MHRKCARCSTPTTLLPRKSRTLPIPRTSATAWFPVPVRYSPLPTLTSPITLLRSFSKRTRAPGKSMNAQCTTLGPQKTISSTVESLPKLLFIFFPTQNPSASSKRVRFSISSINGQCARASTRKRKSTPPPWMKLPNSAASIPSLQNMSAHPATSGRASPLPSARKARTSAASKSGSIFPTSSVAFRNCAFPQLQIWLHSRSSSRRILPLSFHERFACHSEVVSLFLSAGPAHCRCLPYQLCGPRQSLYRRLHHTNRAPHYNCQPRRSFGRVFLCVYRVHLHQRLARGPFQRKLDFRFWICAVVARYGGNWLSPWLCDAFVYASAPRRGRIRHLPLFLQSYRELRTRKISRDLQRLDDCWNEKRPRGRSARYWSAHGQIRLAAGFHCHWFD